MKLCSRAVLVLVVLAGSGASQAAPTKPLFQISGQTQALSPGTGVKGYTYAMHVQIPLPADVKRDCKPQNSDSYKALQSVVSYAHTFALFATWTFMCEGSAPDHAYKDTIDFVVEPFLDAQVGDLNDLLAYVKTFSPYGKSLALSRITELRDELEISVMTRQGYLFSTWQLAPTLYDNYTSFFYYPDADFSAFQSKDYNEFIAYAKRWIPTFHWDLFLAALARSTKEEVGVEAFFKTRGTFEDGSTLYFTPRGGAWRDSVRVCSAAKPCMAAQ